MNTHQVPVKVRAFAPGSLANLAVGFDLLGHNANVVGDYATVTRCAEPGVKITAIHGCPDLSLEANKNTAGVALQALIDDLQLPYGFHLELEKGIPLGSGLGGSAASCVAALVAANQLLDEPMPLVALYPMALAGEELASGSRHGDNIGSMLIGGLALATQDKLVSIPVPSAWHAAVVHPHVVLETRRAREALAGAYSLSEFVAQSSHLALVLAGCFKSDAGLVRAGLSDVLIEPRRANLIPGFQEVKNAALAQGAMGASISGGGPSVFAWFEDRDIARKASLDMQAGFSRQGLESDVYVMPVASPGAHVVDVEH